MANFNTFTKILCKSIWSLLARRLPLATRRLRFILSVAAFFVVAVVVPLAFVNVCAIEQEVKHNTSRKIELRRVRV